MPRIACCLLVVLLLPLAACGRGLVPARHAEGRTFNQPREPSHVRNAVMRATQGRGYQVETEQPGRVIALYTRGNIAFRVGIDYSAQGFAIGYLGSSGLRVEQDDNGEYMIDARYARWAEGLARTIQQELDRGGPYVPPPPGQTVIQPR